ncbi:uncharacterized protein RAG0_06250 [Rhynchosporium agropyri]|uniref:Uncharacterized protein n=1 Tax=Rhynchosporium agropyri TaxID=914238 RepID=A0A1E1KGI0_9HELO|nr:uncharacterized protein RAG0_06250 [Rhynchosporium agropyri]
MYYQGTRRVPKKWIARKICLPVNFKASPETEEDQYAMSMSVFNSRFESGSVYASIMKRTVFVPKKGFIKLTLPEAKTGDHVATLAGSQSSFILRREDDVGRYSFFDEFHRRAMLISEMIENIEKGIHEMVKV